LIGIQSVEVIVVGSNDVVSMRAVLALTSTNRSVAAIRRVVALASGGWLLTQRER